MSQFNEHPDEHRSEDDDVEGQTGGLYGGAEDFERDPAREYDDDQEEDEAAEIGGE